MAEGLQFAAGGSSASSGQTGIIAQGYAPPRTPNTTGAGAGPVVLGAGAGPIAAGTPLEWNGTEWVATPAGGWEASSNNAPGLEYVNVTGFRVWRLLVTGGGGAGGATVELRGRLKAGAGKTVAAGSLILLLPAAARPAKEVTTVAYNVTAKAIMNMTVKTNGEVVSDSALTEGQEVDIGGCTYPLTIS